MTKKKEKTTKKVIKAPKRTLYELVEESDTPRYICIGALANEGLLRQYEYEQLNKDKITIEPSITEKKFNEIVKKYKEA